MNIIVAMHYLEENSTEPAYSVIQSCVIDNCLRKIEKYFDDQGAQCGLGDVVADLRLMASVPHCAIKPQISASESQ